MLRYAILFGLVLCITAQYNYQTTPKPGNYVPITGFLHNQGLDGTYNFAYQTQDGQTRAETTGADGGVQGAYTYTSPEGQKVQVTYKADKHGFQASSDAIPRDGNSPGYQQQSYQQPSYQQQYQPPAPQPQSYQNYQQPQSYQNYQQPQSYQSYQKPQSYDYNPEQYDPKIAFDHAPSNNYAIGDPSVIANLQKFFG